VEKKDNNEDEGRVKRKDEYPPRTKRETGAGDGRTRGRRRMKEGKKKKREKPRLVIWIESTIYSNPEH